MHAPRFHHSLKLLLALGMGAGLAGCLTRGPESGTGAGESAITRWYHLRDGAKVAGFNRKWILTVPGEGRSLTLTNTTDWALARLLTTDWLEEGPLIGSTAMVAQVKVEAPFVGQLLDGDFLVLQVCWKGKGLFTVEPASSRLIGVAGPATTGAVYRLSRYVFLRQSGGEAVLESPLTPQRCVLAHPGLAALVYALCEGISPTTAIRDAKAFGGLDPEAVESFLGALCAMNMVDQGRGGGK